MKVMISLYFNDYFFHSNGKCKIPLFVLLLKEEAIHFKKNEEPTGSSFLKKSYKLFLLFGFLCNKITGFLDVTTVFIFY